MKKLFILIAALFALTVLPVGAAKPVPSGTIAIAAGSDLTLGGWVSFDYTTANLNGNQDPRIQIMCYQAGAITPENPTGLVYGMAGAASDSFELGGGSSEWKTNGGMGNQGQGRGRENASREVLWCSPHCLRDTQLSMF